MNSCLFFDLDGVLLDSRRVLTASVNYVRELYRLRPLSDKNIAACFGGGVNDMLASSLADLEGGVPPDAYERLRQHYLQHFSDLAEVFPGVSTALAELDSVGCIHVLLTDRPEQITRQILAQYDLLHVFDAVCEIGKQDDYGDILRSFLREYSAAPEDAGMLSCHGDCLANGHEIGIYTAFPGYSFFAPPKQKCDLIAATFADFAQEMILKKLNRLA